MKYNNFLFQWYYFETEVLMHHKVEVCATEKYVPSADLLNYITFSNGERIKHQTMVPTLQHHSHYETSSSQVGIIPKWYSVLVQEILAIVKCVVGNLDNTGIKLHTNHISWNRTSCSSVHKHTLGR